MGHPFGDLLTQHLHRKHGLSQAKLAEGILQSPIIITYMCQGKRLTGAQARERVLAIIRWLHQQGVLTTCAEADALLMAAGMAGLDGDQPAEVDLFQALHTSTEPVKPAHDLLPQPRTNLPVYLTGFIGRHHDQVEIRALLRQHRLVTLAGPGGSGKTRLGLELAHQIVPTYPEGVWLVELASLNDPALVPQTVASVFGIQPAPGQTVTDALITALQGRRLLLMLDNCEHLIDACARLAGTLLAACPRLQLLATSREGLELMGEAVYRVPPLTLPDPHNLPPLDALAQIDAIRLFIDRVALAVPGFTLTTQNASAVVQICVQLDGMPLALELAAARLRSIPVAELASRLQDRFRLLTGGNRTALPRQQTLRATIDWSYQLLSELEQQLLRRLAVFAGGWMLDAAEGICAGEQIDGSLMLDLLDQHVNKSLVLLDTAGEMARYRMLETIRQYAHERLAEAGEEEQLRAGHTAWFVAFAERSASDLQGPQQIAALERLELEQDNLRAALDWALAHAPEDAGRIAGSLRWFWHMRGIYRAEGLAFLKRVLAVRTSISPPVQIRVLAAAVVLGAFLGDQSTNTWLSDGVALAHTANDSFLLAEMYTAAIFMAYIFGDPRITSFTQAGLYYGRIVRWARAEAFALLVESVLVGKQGDRTRQMALLQEAMQIARSAEDVWSIRLISGYLGYAAVDARDLPLARMHFEERMALSHLLREEGGIGSALDSLGRLALVEHDYAGARRMWQEALRPFRDIGELRAVVNVLTNLIWLSLNKGELHQAHAELREALTILRGIVTNPRSYGLMLELAGVFAWKQDQPHMAARLLAVGTIVLAVHIDLINAFPWTDMWQAEVEQTIAALRRRLGDDAFTAAWAEGQALTLEQALAAALEVVSAEIDEQGANTPADTREQPPIRTNGHIIQYRKKRSVR